MLTFCTLFNTNYLDKGLTLYESLVEVTSNFELYVLAMDDRCYEILNKLSDSNLKPIKLADFEDEKLLEVKKTRTPGEYCWTCTASLIRYVLNTYNPEHCAYIDSDLYFYSDPQCIIDEMLRRGASVQITGHRFYDDVSEELSWKIGKYCVEYNTFMNNDKAKALLEKWRNQCIEHCSIDGDGVYWADQKYMDSWVSENDFVIETENKGAGVAPWNIAKYKYHSKSGERGLKCLCEGEVCNLLFYHFQGIKYINRKTILIGAFERKGTQRKLVYGLYLPYLKHIDKVKQMLLERFGVEVILKSHPGVANKSKGERFIALYNVIKEIVLHPFGAGNNLNPIISKHLNKVHIE